MEEKYKLIGYINAFGLHPSFVLPIFKRDGKYYYQNIDLVYQDEIIGFDELEGKFFLDLIRPFDR